MTTTVGSIVLRMEMAKPQTVDTELSKLTGDLYRPNARIGSGSTASAIRFERLNGETVGGKLHAQKARDYIAALQRWLQKNPTASAGDRAAAENVIRDR
ncbi:hypothetical protein ACNTMW_33960 [Planosporangium sp. 12N6]|uniref:hypothetical protein n=1 Tax=Planosporangium spinosum TaxID=3402278 RepID=UPI003CF67197